ncbi:PRTRC system protein A [Burkholderia perseverans]|uniref:PRTRC system protein A n=1 Tax=Burkholderia perseverans TaxID=2615214 RepID=UPI001FEF8228|nr:PRTRC system protein A [Burkholderia perseverans]
MSATIDSIKQKFEVSTATLLQQLGATLTTFSTDIVAEVKAGQQRPIAADPTDEALQLDNALFDSAPVAVVPRHAKFAALQDIGHRFLVAAEGLFIEIRRPWLHLIQPLAAIDGSTRPPYGSIEPKIEFAFGKLGAAEPHFRRFADEAGSASPNEHAAWIVWNDTEKKLEYKSVAIRSATPGSLEIDRPALAEHESLVIDLHSHGAGKAFFSSTDDRDDAGEVKISGVIGGLGTGAEKSVVFRLCALGRAIQLRVPVRAFFPEAA